MGGTYDFYDERGRDSIKNDFFEKGRGGGGQEKHMVSKVLTFR